MEFFTRLVLFISLQQLFRVSQATDYRSAPARPFRYGFNVTNSEQGQEFFHRQDVKQGQTSGEYRIHLPDGRWQIVSYIADDKGYRPFVRYEDPSQPASPTGPTTWDHRYYNVPHRPHYNQEPSFSPTTESYRSLIPARPGYSPESKASPPHSPNPQTDTYKQHSDQYSVPRSNSVPKTEEYKPPGPHHAYPPKSINTPFQFHVPQGKQQSVPQSFPQPGWVPNKDHYSQVPPRPIYPPESQNNAYKALPYQNNAYKYHSTPTANPRPIYVTKEEQYDPRGPPLPAVRPELSAVSHVPAAQQDHYKHPSTHPAPQPSPPSKPLTNLNPQYFTPPQEHRQLQTHLDTRAQDKESYLTRPHPPQGHPPQAFFKHPEPYNGPYSAPRWKFPTEEPPRTAVPPQVNTFIVHPAPPTRFLTSDPFPKPEYYPWQPLGPLIAQNFGFQNNRPVEPFKATERPAQKPEYKPTVLEKPKEGTNNTEKAYVNAHAGYKPQGNEPPKHYHHFDQQHHEPESSGPKQERPSNLRPLVPPQPVRPPVPSRPVDQSNRPYTRPPVYGDGMRLLYGISQSISGSQHSTSTGMDEHIPRDFGTQKKPDNPVPPKEYIPSPPPVGTLRLSTINPVFLPPPEGFVPPHRPSFPQYEPETAPYFPEHQRPQAGQHEPPVRPQIWLKPHGAVQVEPETYGPRPNIVLDKPPSVPEVGIERPYDKYPQKPFERPEIPQRHESKDEAIRYPPLPGHEEVSSPLGHLDPTLEGEAPTEGPSIPQDFTTAYPNFKQKERPSFSSRPTMGSVYENNAEVSNVVPMGPPKPQKPLLKEPEPNEPIDLLQLYPFPNSSKKKTSPGQRIKSSDDVLKTHGSKKEEKGTKPSQDETDPNKVTPIPVPASPVPGKQTKRPKLRVKVKKRPVGNNLEVSPEQKFSKLNETTVKPATFPLRSNRTSFDPFGERTKPLNRIPEQDIDVRSLNPKTQAFSNQGADDQAIVFPDSEDVEAEKGSNFETNPSDDDSIEGFPPIEDDLGTPQRIRNKNQQPGLRIKSPTSISDESVPTTTEAPFETTLLAAPTPTASVTTTTPAPTTTSRRLVFPKTKGKPSFRSSITTTTTTPTPTPRTTRKPIRISFKPRNRTRLPAPVSRTIPNVVVLEERNETSKTEDKTSRGFKFPPKIRFLQNSERVAREYPADADALDLMNFAAVTEGFVDIIREPSDDTIETKAELISDEPVLVGKVKILNETAESVNQVSVTGSHTTAEENEAENLIQGDKTQENEIFELPPPVTEEIGTSNVIYPTESRPELATEPTETQKSVFPKAEEVSTRD